MRLNPILLIAGLMLLSSTVFSQSDSNNTIRLKNGVLTPEKNISTEKLNELDLKANRVNGQLFAVIQFEEIPTFAQRNELAANGIELMGYISGKAYSASISGKINVLALSNAKAVSVFQLSPEQKMAASLLNGRIPGYALKIPGKADVLINFPETLSYAEIKQLLQEKNIEIINDDYKNYQVLTIRTNQFKLNELASYPFIEYVQPALHGDQPLNLISRGKSKGNILNAAVAVGGFDLNGENVTIGVGDDADPQYHVDFTGRLIKRGPAPNSYHGNHVTGTVGGNGNRASHLRGYSSRSTIVSQYFSGIIVNTPAYVNDYNMVITNSSYGDVVGECDYAGTYDLISAILDQQIIDFPSLQHVFAAGNDGDINCAPYPASFKTVLGSYQSSKNIITVGAIDKNNAIASFSSRGPVKDGRIKPEISALGVLTVSTIPGNNYSISSGTSMSSPAVAGGLGLLYQRYRQLHGGADPKSGLMKAVICNGAYDLGNAGPDYTFGFGSMNLLRSVDMINNSRYFISSLNNGENNSHTITVPANSAQLKVMLYWHDPAAAVFSTHTLVNDIDLELADPSATTHFPFILDTIPANVNNIAATGADHINNIEQIVITNPVAGNYNVTVKGTSVTQSAPQEYFVVYDIVPNSLQLTYPAGGEGFNPGETEVIQWESYGDPANTFTVEYSLNNGATWTVINNNVAATARQLDWAVPNVQTELAKIRVSKNGTAFVSAGQNFTIINVPTVTASAIQCPGYFAFQWNAVTGATDYELFRLLGKEMVSIGTTAALSYTLSGLSPDSVYWVSIQPRLNGVRGRRALAISRQPNNGTCAGAISDNDLRLDSIIAPLSGRVATSSSLTVGTQIIARVKNLDDAPVNNFKIRYTVNGGAWVEETVSTPVAAGATYTHNFSTLYNFSPVANYELKVEVENTAAADPVSANNLITDTIKQIANDPVIFPFTDDLETAAPKTYNKIFTGLEGIERYDFSRTTALGQAHTFLNTGMAYSGNRSLLLDLDGYLAAGNSNYITGTYNLNGINAAVRDIRLDFQYKQHGDNTPHPDNSIWVRGSDISPWINVFSLSANGNEPGIFKKTPSIEMSDFLTANGQDFSSSFQIRFGQFGRVRISDNFGIYGNSFDDIHLYEAIDDIQMLKIDTPITNSCGLGNAVPVKVTVRNSASSAITNVPVQFIIDGGAPVTEVIPVIGAEATIVYTFTATANLSSLGNHTVKAIVNYLTDNFRDNDTIVSNVVNTPVINSFPYLEDFETGNGHWYSAGINNSWEFGIPASQKIKKAASGNNAWKTSLTGNYNTRELSYLYSPCYNISAMTNPTLSVSIALDLEDCGSTLCDGAWFEYSGDGVNWTKLGTAATGTNWYNTSTYQVWSVEDYTNWHVATTPLPTGYANLRLRLVLESDPFLVREGVGLDDIHIYDNTEGIYDGITLATPVTQSIPGGTNWIDFTSGGKLIASINPNNQNMGSTDVQAYINTAAVRNDGSQYYHNRNITIKPTTTNLTDSAIVRFYFLDAEVDTLIKATGCAGCAKPSSAYQLGVSKYTDTDKNFENGSISDNIAGNWLFINNTTSKKVPFDKGYYAEFKVKDFSEFWLNSGGPDKQTPLPLDLISFTAKKINTDNVLAEWVTTGEYNVSHFELEVAAGSSNYLSGKFVSISDNINPLGNFSTENKYSFTDTQNPKSGTRYYRLKIVNTDGTFAYSSVIPVVFNNDFTWQVYPNPSTDGSFQLMWQLADNETGTVKIFSADGKLIKQLKLTGNGFIQKEIINLKRNIYPSGLYLVQVKTKDQTQAFRIIKE